MVSLLFLHGILLVNMKSKFLTLTIILFSCSTGDKYDPNTYLSAREKAAVMTSIIRYAGRPPESLSEKEHYEELLRKARFEKYFVQGEDYYFLISQPAPSLVEKRHATGGRFKLNDKGELTEYEEIFRTWKMIPDTLKRRSSFLFDKMVKQESLVPYYTKNSDGVEYIEFPDDRVVYDKNKRKWEVIN